MIMQKYLVIDNIDNKQEILNALSNFYTDEDFYENYKEIYAKYGFDTVQSYVINELKKSNLSGIDLLKRFFEEWLVYSNNYQEYVFNYFNLDDKTIINVAYYINDQKGGHKMSLNWNITKVENWQKKKRSKKQKTILETLIWSTLVIGFQDITKRNYKKFYARLTAYEHVRGSFLYKGSKPYYITLEDVENWIGLCTNAGTFSASKFESRLIK